MRFVKLVAAVTLSMISVSAHAAALSEEVMAKVIAQGVSADAVQRMSTFLGQNEGRSFSQSTYFCDENKPESVKPCEEKKRIASRRDVTLQNPEYVAIIDFSLASTEKRFYLINTKTGVVNRYYTSHGVGTSQSNYASRFSNTKDSRQTSLGFYLGGGMYNGKYGNTMRMYGVDKSNDQAYNRDIVLHGAWYVGENFMKEINPKTKLPFGRIGHSWGCPAVETGVIAKVSGLLKEGGVMLHYHPRLMEEAQKGTEVVDPEQPISAAIPVPQPRPELPLAPQST